MSNTRFAYASRLACYNSMMSFLTTSGWTAIYSRPSTVVTEPALTVLEGGTDSKWERPAILGFHYLPNLNKIAVQAFKVKGELEKGFNDNFATLDMAAWDTYIGNPLSTFTSVGGNVRITPDISDWTPPGAVTHTTMSQPAPGREYGFRATLRDPDNANTACTGLFIKTALSTYNVRLYLTNIAGAFWLYLDYYEAGVGITLAYSAVIPLAAGEDIDLYIEQLGGLIYTYYRVEGNDWVFFGEIELDERNYFPGTESCGIFAASPLDATFTADWDNFVWPTFMFGHGEPLYFGGQFGIDPTALGDAVVYADQNRIIPLLVPNVGGVEILYAGSFEDQPKVRPNDSKVCLIKPYKQKAALYSKITDTALLRDNDPVGVNEAATASLTTPVAYITNEAYANSLQPQTRASPEYILHPYFLGAHGAQRQMAGETKNLYAVDWTGAPPVDLDLIACNNYYYLYYAGGMPEVVAGAFGGIAFGPITPLGPELVHPGTIITWVNPYVAYEYTDLQPQNFLVYEGAEQPQIVIEWSEPNAGWDQITSVKLMRKLQEYPRDVTDGDVLYTGDGTALGHSDRTVLPHNFYYYKLFFYKNGWHSDYTLQGIGWAWESGWSENKIYQQMLSDVFRKGDTIQTYEMTQATREDTPEVINFQEDGEKGFLLRMLKNYGLEVDRIRAFLQALNLTIDPMEMSLNWIPHFAYGYGADTFRADHGLRQKNDITAWPFWLKKKGCERVWEAIVWQTLNVAPTFVYGRQRAAHASYLSPSIGPLGCDPERSSITWDPGQIATWMTSADVYTYTQGWRTCYNDKGVLLYLTGTFTATQLAELRYKLAQFLPATTVMSLFVNDVEVFKTISAIPLVQHAFLMSEDINGKL